MKIRFSVLVILIVSAIGVSAQEASYSDLVAKVQGGDVTVDFQALRFAFAAQPALIAVTDDMKGRAAMIKAVNDKNFKEALRLADAQQKVSYVDMNSHIVASMAYQGLGDEKKAKFHESIYLGLVNSILKSGDGETPKTAYAVISVAEEFVLLKALELKRTGSESITENGHKYNVLTVTDGAGATSKIYFNVDRAAAASTKPAEK